MIQSTAIIGRSGALAEAIAAKEIANNNKIYCFSRASNKAKNYHTIKYDQEASIQQAIKEAEIKQLDKIFSTIGILHTKTIKPEKSLKNINLQSMLEIMRVNAISQALIAKNFIPYLNKNQKSIFVLFSARVGSISDNKIGGWYSYRASKAALNMLVKTLAIELKRINKKAIIISFHPGTVDSNLSKPFQKNIAPEKIFSPKFAIDCLFKLIENLDYDDSGKFFDWKGEEIKP